MLPPALSSFSGGLNLLHICICTVSTQVSTRLLVHLRSHKSCVCTSPFQLQLLLPAGNPVTAFMPRNCSAAQYNNFLQRVEQASAAGRFHKKPIGPIGAKLSLQDEKWALAVELAVGRAFNTFVVHDFADQAMLKVCLLPSAIRWYSLFRWYHFSSYQHQH